MNEIDYKKKYKIGDIIYPFYNNTYQWYRNNVWSVVVKIDKKGNWKHIKSWYCQECAELHSMFLKQGGEDE